MSEKDPTSDDSDELLEEHAEEFVKNYVQKPGFGDKGGSCVDSTVPIEIRLVSQVLRKI